MEIAPIHLVRLAFHGAGSLDHGGRIVTGFWLSPMVQPPRRH
jgi:hypothetical protein